MQVTDPAEVKKIKEARTLITELQKRLWQTEQALDDLSRATEIAQYSKNYDVVGSFRDAAEDLLKDRLSLPEHDLSDYKVTIVETTQEGWEQGKELTKDHDLKELKHNITTIMKEGEEPMPVPRT